jgi:hypothetical protein
MIINSYFPIINSYRQFRTFLNNCVIILQQFGIFATPCMYNLHFMCVVFTTTPIKSILLKGLAK